MSSSAGCSTNSSAGTILGRTWVLITADHGESFGEQPGVFWHGTSLYQAQLQVPLVIVPPAGGPTPRVVTEPVSPRDLAATIVDVLGLGAGSPFPGVSLARFWNRPSPMASTKAAASVPVLSEVIPLDSFGAMPRNGSTSRDGRWPPCARTTGSTFAAKETFAKNCST